MADVVLIVDDEESIRKTFREWLVQSNLNVEVMVAADVETALKIAAENPIDLAILDWNLGSGSDGLQLLEDLLEFRPHLVAILVTGFANQATPLEALRMGIRDYLDKNQDLTRETLVSSVRKQLDRIRPAKRERQLQDSLRQFHDAIEKMLPLLQSARALNNSMSLPASVGGLIRFLVEITESQTGILVARHHTSDGQEHYLAFHANGDPVTEPLVPFSQSLAATILSLGKTQVFDLHPSQFAPALPQPFEQGRKTLLAVPLNVAPTTRVVIELFDKPQGYSIHDERLVRTAADFGTELLKQAISDRQSSRMLVDALEAAFDASERLGQHLSTPVENAQTESADDPLKAATEAIRRNLTQDRNSPLDAETTISLAETIREIATHHGSQAARHCLQIMQQLRVLLDSVNRDI